MLSPSEKAKAHHIERCRYTKDRSPKAKRKSVKIYNRMGELVRIETVKLEGDREL